MRAMTVDFRVCRSCNLCDRRSARHDGRVASPLRQMLHRIFTMPADGHCIWSSPADPRSRYDCLLNEIRDAPPSRR